MFSNNTCMCLETKTDYIFVLNVLFLAEQYKINQVVKINNTKSSVLSATDEHSVVND